MLSWIRNKWTNLCLLVMALGALILFLYGYFPLKYHSGKYAHIGDLPNFIDDVSLDGQTVYYSGENSVVLMVIDSLRYDFVTPEYMPYTAELLVNKTACLYVSLAEPPTVTMPRIKAMMTGSVSTFADVAFNFGAPEVKGDSVPRVTATRGRRNIMYGDDTWLRLFPGLWAEHDGTTSFYVTDYTEVDNNVTRHLDKVLSPDKNNKPTFDFLVLHYLGLDHIGHLEGARSPKIKPKLLEMDAVIQKIFTAMSKWDKSGVLFISGDHGMRDAGGHGGSSPAEVLVPLVLAKSQFFECLHPEIPGPIISQVDIAPSIAWLLNVPPPGDNTGRILPSLMPADKRQHLYLLHLLTASTAKQPSISTDTEIYKQFKRAEKQFAQFLATGQESAAKLAKDYYEESLDLMAQHIAKTSTTFDLFALATSTMLLYIIAAALLCITLYSFQPDYCFRSNVLYRTKKAGFLVAFLVVLGMWFGILTMSCFITETKSRLCTFDPIWGLTLFLIACVFTMSYFIIKICLEKIRDITTLKDLNMIDYLLIIGTLCHTLSFFGTSFIEEEHMTWYFFWNTFMLFVLVRIVMVLLLYLRLLYTGSTKIKEKPALRRRIKSNTYMLPKWILLIALHRYLRSMNQTGDRWLFLPDTADWLNEPQNAIFLETHLILGMFATFVICLRNLKFTNNVLQIHTIFTILSTFCILLYRATTHSLNVFIEGPQDWDPVIIVDIFWGLIVMQFIFEILTYVGIFKTCTMNYRQRSNKEFIYNRPKAKREDYIHNPQVEEPLNLDEVKLNLARSLSHLMLNNMMLIVILLMRPHNVIMVPSLYVTCKLAAQCLDHKFFDMKPKTNTDVLDVLCLTLTHFWIGEVFFFYQGNSNSLASIDLGSGYVGLREYCPVRVAARMGLHTYAGPALAGCMLYCSLTLPARGRTWKQYLQSVWRTANIFAFQRTYELVIYCLIAFLFRNHLFVWSVFSPKLLYDFVDTIFTIQALATIAHIVGFTHAASWIARTITYKTRL